MPGTKAHPLPHRALLHAAALLALLGALVSPRAGAAGQNLACSLRVQRGGVLAFNFNSYTRFATGIAYENYTTLRVDFSDTDAQGDPNPASQGWRLKVRPLQASLTGDMAAQHLALSALRLWVTREGNTGAPIELTAGETTLLTVDQPPAGQDWSSVVEHISIGYDFGKNPAGYLLNQIPDNYTLDLDFILESVAQ